MSDDQIRDLFQNAEPWSPDDDGGDIVDGGANGTVPASVPALPPLQFGSDVEIARCVAQLLSQERGEVVFSEGQFWYYGGSYWCKIDDNELRLAVHRYDSATVSGGSSRIKLGKTRIDSVLCEMRAILARPNFFAEAPVGINCASGFIAFAQDGRPTLRPHDPGHRRRHALRGDWSENGTLDLGELFLGFESLGLLLPRLLRGVFLDDPDAQQKRLLLAEVAGAAALGYGSKLRQPKAVILEGQTAENGKSQVLDLFRGLLPPEAVASIPAAKMGDQHFVVGLIGKHLNASDELSGAEAIAGDVFKAVITGEPVTGRDLYCPPITFRPVAQNVFATNALPSFKGGLDKGVQRRLLVVTFNRTIPEDERVENIGLRIADEEADWLLMWAVAGASRLIQQRAFTIPPSSKDALRDWLLGADPVLAWLQSCVEVVTPNSPDWEKAVIKSRDAHAAFVSWAKSEGFRESTLTAINGFVQRLHANCPSIRPKHTRGGNVLVGIRLISCEGEPAVAGLFSGRPR
jgi:phage/plasmid-associated DNA primase